MKKHVITEKERDIIKAFLRRPAVAELLQGVGYPALRKRFIEAHHGGYKFTDSNFRSSARQIGMYEHYRKFKPTEYVRGSCDGSRDGSQPATLAEAVEADLRSKLRHPHEGDTVVPWDPTAVVCQSFTLKFATPGPPEELGAFEQQVGGSYYKDMPIQPMKFSVLNGLNPAEHNVLKRICRWRRTGGQGVEDLLKAKHEIDLLIAMESDILNK